MKPTVFTFDIFGTVLDWKTGFSQALSSYGIHVTLSEFDRLIDIQERLESKPHRPYREIVADGLVEGYKLHPDDAHKIGENVGAFPLFNDSIEGLKNLMKIAPCVAITNSDYAHGEQVQKSLGFKLSHWFCAEELKRYKPDPICWTLVAQKLGLSFNKGWYHVSAYGDYDLQVTAKLGLTSVFINRAHSRVGPCDLTFADLVQFSKSFSI